MALIFRFTDGASTVRLDMNTTSGWVLGRGLNLGAANLESVWLSQPPYDGAELASSYRPIVTMTIPLIMTKQANAAAMKTLFDALVTELDRTANFIEYRPDGYATSYLIDTYRASIPSLLGGVFAPTPFLLLQTQVPLTLTIPRKPQLRTAGSYI